MSKIKSLILGSAAGLVAIAGAQAADLPLKAKAVEYVKVCSLYGAGFYYIPGTDTCIKLGGYLRFDANYHGGVYDAPFWSFQNGANTRDVNQLNMRSRMAVTIDTRTATEYGVVRTFGQGDWQWSTGTDVPGGGSFALENAFVQFAGFTFGKSASVYATPWHGYPGNNTSFLLGGEDSVTGVNNIHYTFDFGNGFSASLGVDEGIAFDRTTLANLALGGITNTGLNTLNGYGGQDAPDFVGNLKLDQAWGLLQVSGAAHQIRPGYYGATEAFGGPESEWGFAVMGAIELRNLPTGPGDYLRFDASYADGATKYVIATSGASPSFGMINGNTVGFGLTSDGVYGAPGIVGNGDIQKTQAWGIRGAYAHNWNPYWQSSVFGSYSQVRYNGDAAALYCAAYGATVAGLGATYGCDPDFNIAQVGFRTVWTPVKNLALSAEVQHVMLDTGFTGTTAGAYTVGTKVLPVANFGDVHTTSVNFRIQRNF
jgi:hypothetical protein